MSVTESRSENEQPATSEPGEVAPVQAEGHGRRRAGRDGVHHTRIGGAWVAVAVAVVLGVALIDFIVQNTRSVRVEFFAANGQMPVAVALLGAALAGAFLVLAVGVARTTQLRIANRRGKKREEHAASLAADTAAQTESEAVAG